MNNPFRRFLFRHYWWIVIVVLLFAVPATIATSQPEAKTTNLAAVCGAALGIVYFIQKQKIEEFQIFERLFSQFNERYSALNEPMQRIFLGSETNEDNMRGILNDYFNLCAEEYLFYQHGHIHPLVWKSWCKGMDAYLKSERIRSHLVIEILEDSYYGFTLAVVKAGCA